MTFSFHHLTLDSEIIIKNLMHKEQMYVEEYELAVEFEKTFVEDGIKRGLVPETSYLTMAERGNVPVQVVMKRWKSIISVYPINATLYHEENVPWCLNKSDSRKNSITQKSGRIIAYWDAELLRLGFLLKGEVISELEMPIEDSLLGSEEYTLQRCASEEMLHAMLNKDVVKQADGLSLDIPLMLPSAWKETWPICKQSRLITFCD